MAEPVTAVNTQQLCYRSYAMRGIWVTSMPTARFVPSLRTVTSLRETIPPIVDIGSLAMRNRAEKSGIAKLQCGKRKPVVTTVFRHETVPAGCFGSTHQFKALFHRGGGRHFNGYMLSTTHCLHRHAGMTAPIGADINQIKIIATAHLLPSRFPVKAQSFGTPARS